MLEVKEHCAKRLKTQEKKRFKKNCFSTELDKSVKQLWTILMIYGVPEDDRETWEATEIKATDTIKNYIKVDISGADVERAHRIGKKVDNEERPIIGNRRTELAATRAFSFPSFIKNASVIRYYNHYFYSYWKRPLKLHQIIEELEHNADEINVADNIVIFPPENVNEETTDEDCGDEVMVDINNLPGSQLRSEVEVFNNGDELESSQAEYLSSHNFDSEDDLPLSLFIKRFEVVQIPKDTEEMRKIILDNLEDEFPNEEILDESEDEVDNVHIRGEDSSTKCRR
ncbi:hypothetical protein QE152_g25206 [Popillia japonica]|uniref:Uncharacterized protein n=1 Tax=Popillia japonica TaxID=7064 RepID=A0AAW1K2Q5_POPJA